MTTTSPSRVSPGACRARRVLVAQGRRRNLGRRGRARSASCGRRWRDHLGGTESDVDYFRGLEVAKKAHQDYPEGACPFAERFIHSFYDQFTDLWDQKTQRVDVYRHARTALNDGRFLGQGQDPAILDAEDIVPADTAPDAVWCSPALRARQTVAALFPGVEPQMDDDLKEINYGEVENLPIAELATQFPDLPAAWARGEDPRFPGGENTEELMMNL